ncbi:MAG: NAD(P)/FAD-dependent oxidoreductase [Betaproteobacteria bacterium]
MDNVLDCVVVGAGVVGLAVARALALAGREVVVLEAAEGIGTGTSSRNSEVIHAGIYYPKGSLKARLCVQGKQALYAYCAERGVPHRRCGKLIVATEAAQLATLADIRAKAAANGVGDLKHLSRQEAQALEPEIECVGALLSPSTGIIDSHAFMLALQGDAEHAGAVFAFFSRVARARVVDGGFEIEVQTLDLQPTSTGTPGAAASGTAGSSGHESAEFSSTSIWHARTLINVAGLHAPDVAARIEGLDARHVPRAHYARGHYFSLSGRPRFQRLIYPVPQPGGLGVHLTLDLQGQARFGPDVQWVDGIDYTVDPRRADAFYAEVRRYWPALPDGALQPGYAGIRPKLAGPEAPNLDFRIDGPAQHGVPGLVNLLGIESPGLTASLAIGEAVVEALLKS